MMRMHVLAAVALATSLQQPSAPTVVYVAIEDERGTTLAGLSAADVEVVVGDSPVPVGSLSSVRAPLSLVVLIDITRSSRWRARPLDEQLAGFASWLRSDDRIAIHTFGARTTVMPFGPASEKIRDAARRAVDVPDARRDGPSPIWDAVHEAVTLLAKEPQPRAVLLMTDGRATGNRRGLGEVADYAAQHSVPVYVLAQHAGGDIRQRHSGGGTAARVQPAVPLEQLAVYSGGQVFVYPERQQEEAERLFTYIADRLRTLYTLTFTAPSPGPHTLKVHVKRPGGHVHAPLAVWVRK